VYIVDRGPIDRIALQCRPIGEKRGRRCDWRKMIKQETDAASSRGGGGRIHMLWCATRYWFSGASSRQMNQRCQVAWVKSSFLGTMKWSWQYSQKWNSECLDYPTEQGSHKFKNPYSTVFYAIHRPIERHRETRHVTQKGNNDRIKSSIFTLNGVPIISIIVECSWGALQVGWVDHEKV